MHPTRFMSLRKPMAAVAFLMAATIMTTGCGLFPKEAEILAPPLKEPPKVTYKLVEAKKGTVETAVRCSASFVAVQQHEMNFTVGGNRLKRFLVASGDEVKAGDVLVETDAANLESQIKLKELEVEEATDSRNLAVKSATANRDIAELDIASLTRQISDARKVGDRTVDLENQLKKANLNLIRDNLDAEGKRQQLDISIRKLNIQLADLRAAYNQTRIIAPVSGEVVYIADLKAGDTIDAYRTLITVADPSKLRLVSSDSDITKLTVGMPVEVTMDGNMDVVYKGKVALTPADMPVDATESERQRAYFSVEGIPTTTNIGSGATVKIVMARRENVIVLAKNLLHETGGRSMVQVMDNGVKKEREVELGLQSNTEVEVVKGLSEGEQVIVY